MVDFHTHILPNIDDGASSVSESIDILKLLREQHVDTIIATPHFYANKNYPQEFLDSREKAFNGIRNKILRAPFNLLLGAEVYYFSGMGNCEDLKLLTITGTNLLLVELPYKVWDQQILLDLKNIQSKLGLQVIIALLDRYINCFNYKKWIEYFTDCGYIIQFNLQVFYSLWFKNIFLNLITTNDNIILGSDCHNLKERAPSWNYPNKVLVKKFGAETAKNIHTQMESILTKHQNLNII